MKKIVDRNKQENYWNPRLIFQFREGSTEPSFDSDS